MISQFHHYLDHHGFEVDERGDDVPEGDPIEEWPLEDREARFEEALKGVKTNGGKVGLFKISHIGGHRYAGNCIIYFPSGSSVWYGRVTPKDVAAIVQQTVMEGKVIPELLRGGFGIVDKTGPHGIMQW